ncbi:hypothetical protein PRIPAC_91678 [Pristionchus pacificus]|uniref:Uncharacterized protein n=1 Tax=Pristionchus pacificus TaxID=54126 RepID=A0A454XQM4_PRIPA|nr:hypothetical protein PRIPAC_91678 [Pristionchus pacificus]|eukprot:PDM77691.1 hypothetical protein PRIPAC_34558 [Pristionchus pacificus]
MSCQSIGNFFWTKWNRVLIFVHLKKAPAPVQTIQVEPKPDIIIQIAPWTAPSQPQPPSSVQPTSGSTEDYNKYYL